MHCRMISNCALVWLTSLIMSADKPRCQLNCRPFATHLPRIIRIQCDRVWRVLPFYNPTSGSSRLHKYRRWEVTHLLITRNTSSIRKKCGKRWKQRTRLLYEYEDPRPHAELFYAQVAAGGLGLRCWEAESDMNGRQMITSISHSLSLTPHTTRDIWGEGGFLEASGGGRKGLSWGRPSNGQVRMCVWERERSQLNLRKVYSSKKKGSKIIKPRKVGWQNNVR